MRKKQKTLQIRLIALFLILLIPILTLAGCNAETDTHETDTLKEKVEQEMRYLDTELLSMLNLLNNITVKNYDVISEKNNESNSSSKSDGGGTSEGNEESEGNSNSSSGSKSSDSSSGSSSSTTSKMQRESVLTNSKDVDWNTMKSNIEILYSSWSPIILDLYKLNINNEDILSFNKVLDNTIIFIKNEDKTNTAIGLATLYSYIPKYIEAYSDDNVTINLAKTKSSIINSYAMMESDDWDGIQKQIADAENSYMAILNNISEQEKSYNINKGYVLLKELQNSLVNQDKDIYYIKYKNLMEELNLLKKT